MNLDPSPSAGDTVSPELDALVLVIDEELALLKTLHFRLTVLRLLLVNDDPYFIQCASADVAAATQDILEHEAATRESLSSAREVLGLTSERLAVIASRAPESHSRVLDRLSGELESRSRSIEALRDAVRRQCEAGRRTVLDVLDLTDGPVSPSGATSPGHLFHGQL